MKKIFVKFFSWIKGLRAGKNWKRKMDKMIDLINNKKADRKG